jgi:hypothetical protein
LKVIKFEISNFKIANFRYFYVFCTFLVGYRLINLYIGSFLSFLLLYIARTYIVKASLKKNTASEIFLEALALFRSVGVSRPKKKTTIFFRASFSRTDVW